MQWWLVQAIEQMKKIEFTSAHSVSKLHLCISFYVTVTSQPGTRVSPAVQNSHAIDLAVSMVSDTPL